MAHRVDSYNKAVVFSEQSIPLGAMFQVKLLDKGGGWAGSIVSRSASGRRGIFLKVGVAGTSELEPTPSRSSPSFANMFGP